MHRGLFRPEDRCPFSAPVRRFGECRGFAPAVRAVSDSRGKPLESVICCAHLMAAGVGKEGRFYPRCGLGSAFVEEVLGLTREEESA